MEVQAGAERLGSDEDHDSDFPLLVEDILRHAYTDWRVGGSPFYRQSDAVPESVKTAIDGHVLHGRAVGNFIFAVLTNDLKAAISTADEANYLYIGAIVSYCVNRIPLACWGDDEKVEYWQRQGGWNGLFPDRQIESVDDRLKVLGVKL